MAPIEACRFRDTKSNTLVRYTFDADARDQDDRGPVSLNRELEPITNISANVQSLAPEPRHGAIIYQYTAKDGGEVRYQYDPGSRNGKDYVVGIYRTPENWQSLREEDLSFPERSRFERQDSTFGAQEGLFKRRDSGVGEDGPNITTTSDGLRNSDNML